MAKAAAKAAKEESAEARALVDLPQHGVLCGRLITSTPDVIAALIAAGQADPHPDAVAYAKTLET